ncbi:BlaI/MecI/CopY family transcriptional regulator [Streptomyces sp. NPDC056387]|uniref:BlaI/MecI/CopY family transcriptional regulator n=1 Tax=Streptomyces sp. NPDC056387 TaxID=3345803 RepID=UPI0035D67988
MDGHDPAGPLQEGERRLANGMREAEVLSVLRSAPLALTPRQVLDRIGGDLAYSTVVTILTRLYDKDVLTRATHGRAFAYAPATDEQGFAARKMHRAMEEAQDREGVLMRFVDDLSSGDEALLRRLLGDLDAGR